MNEWFNGSVLSYFNIAPLHDLNRASFYIVHGKFFIKPHYLPSVNLWNLLFFTCVCINIFMLNVQLWCPRIVAIFLGAYTSLAGIKQKFSLEFVVHGFTFSTEQVLKVKYLWLETVHPFLHGPDV